MYDNLPIILTFYMLQQMKTENFYQQSDENIDFGPVLLYIFHKESISHTAGSQGECTLRPY